MDNQIAVVSESICFLFCPIQPFDPTFDVKFRRQTFECRYGELPLLPIVLHDMPERQGMRIKFNVLTIWRALDRRCKHEGAEKTLLKKIIGVSNLTLGYDKRTKVR